jgi:copper ion binding protein
MISQTFTVAGMTCQHCVNAVSEEVGTLPGVHEVAVDLPSGQVTLSAQSPLDTSLLRQAVDEAGYELLTMVER